MIKKEFPKKFEERLAVKINPNNHPNISLTECWEIDNVFDWSSFSFSEHAIDQDYLESVSKGINTVVEMANANMLKEYLEKKEGDMFDLKNNLKRLAYFIEDNQYNLLGQGLMPRISKREFKKEILLDLIESLSTIYALTQEDKLEKKLIIELIEYVSSSMLWITSKYDDLWNGKMSTEEINALLQRKSDCRVYERDNELPTKKVLNLYEYTHFAFDKDEIEKEKEVNANYLYIFGNYSLEYVKIGITKVSVESRYEAALKFFRNKIGNWDEQLLKLKVIENNNSLDLETYLKNKFRDKLVPGFNSTEWFNLDKEDLNYLLNEGYKSDSEFMKIYYDKKKKPVC